jgi:hypothetical protein
MRFFQSQDQSTTNNKKEEDVIFENVPGNSGIQVFFDANASLGGLANVVTPKLRFWNGLKISLKNEVREIKYGDHVQLRHWYNQVKYHRWCFIGVFQGTNKSGSSKWAACM